MSGISRVAAIDQGLSPYTWRASYYKRHPRLQLAEV